MCGVMLWLGCFRCGRPTQILQCATCGAEIGGTSHNLLDTNVDLEDVGSELYQKTHFKDTTSRNYCIRDAETEAEDRYFSVRILNPTSVRAVRLVMHAALFLGRLCLQLSVWSFMTRLQVHASAESAGIRQWIHSLTALIATQRCRLHSCSTTSKVTGRCCKRWLAEQAMTSACCSTRYALCSLLLAGALTVVQVVSSVTEKGEVALVPPELPAEDNQDEAAAQAAAKRQKMVPGPLFGVSSCMVNGCTRARRSLPVHHCAPCRLHMCVECGSRSFLLRTLIHSSTETLPRCSRLPTSAPPREKTRKAPCSHQSLWRSTLWMISRFASRRNHWVGIDNCTNVAGGCAAHQCPRAVELPTSLLTRSLPNTAQRQPSE